MYNKTIIYLFIYYLVNYSFIYLCMSMPFGCMSMDRLGACMRLLGAKSTAMFGCMPDSR